MSDETEVIIEHADGKGRTIVSGKCRVEFYDSPRPIAAVFDQEKHKVLFVWGSFEVLSGKWYPNRDLKMSADDQYAAGIRAGAICEHSYQPDRCPVCRQESKDVVSKLSFGKRQSGRTTRMLEHAILISRCRPDRHVIVVAANANDRDRLIHELFRLSHGISGVKVVAVGERFDWERMVHNDFPAVSSEFFVDHFAIEMHLAKALKALHRWDAEKT